jgi:SOS-response transcriptional repressor LexA
MGTDQEAAKRLRAAREAAGYKTAAEFARDHEFPEVTYRSHENGTRTLTIPAAKAYAKALGISWQWLMFGEEIGVKPAAEVEPVRRKPKPGGNVMTIDELDVRAGMSLGGQTHEGADLQYSHEQVVARWQIPTAVIRSYTSAPQEAIKIITAIGDSNVPEFFPGDRVMVDVSDRVPSPPGFFAIWDGFGEVIKRVEVVPYSDPPRVLLKSVNPEYETRELPLDQVIINGRVLGKWKWT